MDKLKGNIKGTNPMTDGVMKLECKKDCRHCGQPFSKAARSGRSEWEARQYCSMLCSNIATARLRMVPLSARFWQYVVRGAASECWEWRGCRGKDGYGRIGLGPQVAGVTRAHRASWLIHYGDPGSLHVCHSCDNPPCVNPSHLFIGTHQDNHRDKVAKGRQGRAIGANNANAKLSPGQAMEIYHRILRGEQMKKLANEFSVSPPSVRDIRRGITWRHVTGAVRAAQ